MSNNDAIMQGEVAGYFYIVFVKSFSNKQIFGAAEFELLISTHQSFDWAINKSIEYNQDPFLNLHVEHFAVYFSEKKLKKYDKKSCVKIYPNHVNSL
jgi:hypothetical protein